MPNGDPIVIGQNNSGSNPGGFDPTVVQDSTLFLTSQQGLPLYAYSNRTYGILAESGNSDAVSAASGTGEGVTAFSSTGNGIHGTALSSGSYGVVGDGNGWGGYFNGLVVDNMPQINHSGLVVSGSTYLSDTQVDGNLWINGALEVFGLKLAAVPYPDGSHRALYCLESPESWFEDFGRASVVRGKDKVKLDPRFVAVVKSNDYHIFLSPEGESQGLYVSRRTRTGFEVREQNKGTSTLRFSYRVVARRKDVSVRRFEKVKRPKAPKIPPHSKPKPLVRPKAPLAPSVSAKARSAERA